MKILLLGVFTYGSTDCWKLTALRAAGHTVVPFPYRDRDVRELSEQGEPFDLVIVSKGVPLKPGAWAHVSKLGERRVLYWPDPFENWTDECHGAVFDLHFQLVATSRAVMDRICERDNVTGYGFHVLEGADTSGILPREFPSPEPALLHFGHMSTRRAEFIGKLGAAGVRVNHVTEPTFGADLQSLVLSHAAVLGINSSPDLFSNRVQTVLAMGGCILQEHAPGIEQMQVALGGQGSEVLQVWGGAEDLVMLAARLVVRPERSRMAANRAYELWSWHRWAREIVAPVEVAA